MGFINSNAALYIFFHVLLVAEYILPVIHFADFEISFCTIILSYSMTMKLENINDILVMVKRYD